jgi:SAM-dependent methyltransferase
MNELHASGDQSERFDSAYDVPASVEEYIAMRRRGNSANELLEEPIMRRFLCEVPGSRCLDLGCGFGHYSHMMAEQGFAVTAIDRSELMIEAARRLNAHEAIQYQRTDISEADFAVDTFDVIISNLVLHYVEDLTTLASRMHRWLVSGGTLIFSVEHPIYTANMQQLPPPWCREESNRWMVADYFAAGPRSGAFGIKYHHTTTEYLTSFLNVGFKLSDISEPCPDEKAIERNPKLAECLVRPVFLMTKWINLK